MHYVCDGIRYGGLDEQYWYFILPGFHPWYLQITSLSTTWAVFTAASAGCCIMDIFCFLCLAMSRYHFHCFSNFNYILLLQAFLGQEIVAICIYIYQGSAETRHGNMWCWINNYCTNFGTTLVLVRSKDFRRRGFGIYISLKLVQAFHTH